MPDRALFYAATPEAAYLIVRDQALPNPAEPVPGEADMVELVARRGGCRGGTAVAVTVTVTVNEQDLRPGDPGRPGSFLVPREAITPASIGRAFQPWHADVEPDPHQRWKGYLQPDSMSLRNLVGADTPGDLRTREHDRVTAQLIALAERPVTANFDLDHLRQIYRRLFQDVYPWAGETRTVQIGRPGGAGFLRLGSHRRGLWRDPRAPQGHRPPPRHDPAEFTEEEAARVFNAVKHRARLPRRHGRT